jgi:hypothetical protein
MSNDTVKTFDCVFDYTVERFKSGTSLVHKSRLWSCDADFAPQFRNPSGISYITLAYILQFIDIVSFLSTTEICRPQLSNNIMDSMGLTIKSHTNWSLRSVQSFFSICLIKGRYTEVCGLIMSKTY